MAEIHKKKTSSKPITKARLERAAYTHLERYASSAENLRRVLMRRVQKSAWLHETKGEEGAEWVSALIDRFLRAGLLDDLAYAETKAAGLHRRGVSGHGIAMKLAAKGVASDITDRVLQDLAEEVEGDPDFAAAINCARRRRIGVFRKSDRDQNRQRDLVSLGRQGFSYDIARKIVEAEDEAELLEQHFS